MFKLFNQNKIALLILVSAFFFFFYIAYTAEATYDSGDGIRHYLVSRYCWLHPDLLLYSWGKPFFTLLSSPFSQFGLMGINVFNILCGVGSAFFAYKIAQVLNLKYALLVIPFLLFTPSYFPTLNSGLTEPFFGFILIASIYLMFSERYLWACILVSFLPFVRTEGNLILPLFFIVLLYRRKFLSSLFLAFGTLVYSIIGFFYFNDFFWIKNQNPYDGGNKDFYGTGDLFHFIDRHNLIWGTALGYLFLIGLVALVFNSFQTITHKQIKDKKLPEELFLIYGSFIIYFVAHSIFWWKGLANSLGLLRVLAAVIPCSALICLRGFHFVMIPFLREKKIIAFVIIATTIFWVIRSPFKHEYFPFKMDSEQVVVKQAGEWFIASPYASKKVYYLHPYLPHVLNIDSFNPEKVGELWGLYPNIKAYGIASIPDSSIIFWDAHFGPNECRIPLETLISDANFELLKVFQTDDHFKVLGGSDFNIYVFIKLHTPKNIKIAANEVFDLETVSSSFDNALSVSSEKCFSGKNACKLSDQNEFSVAISHFISETPPNTLKVDYAFKLFDPTNNSKNALVVLSIDDESGKNLFWEGKSIVSIKKDNAEWSDISVSYSLSNQAFPPTSKIKMYIWNKEKTLFYIDDIRINYWAK